MCAPSKSVFSFFTTSGLITCAFFGMLGTVFQFFKLSVCLMFKLPVACYQLGEFCPHIASF